MSENWQQCEIFIVINDKCQGSIAKNLRCDALLQCFDAVGWAAGRASGL